MALKGMDVQIWSGLHTSITAGILEKHEVGRVHTTNLQELMCQISHTWKINNQNMDLLNVEDISILNQRAFSILGGDDRIVWKYNSNGEFCVSSAYWVLIKDKEEVVRHPWALELWKRLWSLYLPFKFIIFLWKICQNCLPVRANLHRRIPYMAISHLCVHSAFKRRKQWNIYSFCVLWQEQFGSELT